MKNKPKYWLSKGSGDSFARRRHRNFRKWKSPA